MSKMKQPIRIGALISGSGTNLQAIMDACASGDIDGRIVFIGSDTPDAAGLERGIRLNIPTFVVNYGSIIRRYKKAPETVTVPDDFDLSTVLSKQTLFPVDADGKTVKAFS